ncbi:uncharacterized protein LOC120086719 [Benincasa hispida]|uniref:uncharacterized protein LOC120086719 n=1 Tax=Benincasa hispida TaxID=102211 RepID=UPI0019012D84|nr:uncharacterized protein LOC120086719 [Benincasa hispida]XP_038899423.1 uncharacterized protein LOC120086719 [Benincasa hispida]XP_038899424.1 uncharacterized protein LOC120086719 [Benincasa hispida]XP_038899426.1 uncharacterized protein LOC120086719 [Benincasa hispida]
MERSEPTLVPEWLRSSGSLSGSGISAQQFASSSSHSDISSQAHYSRSRTSKSISDIDKPHFDFLDWSSSSSSRRSSSNGSGKNAYSSFNRNHRDRDRDKEKEMSNLGDPWGYDFSSPLVNIFSSRVEKETLRRSHSMVSRKQGDLFPQRGAVDLKSEGYNHKVNSNGFHSGSTINGITDKAVFDKDFPSLGSEERQGAPDVGRVSSPGLTTSVQSLPMGSSTFIGREGWTSALAEVPTILTGSLAAPSSVQPTVAATSGLGSPNATTPRKMAEALTQAPTRARVASQSTELSVKTQRLEELAIKQSRQLIPVTPSMPKVSVLNSFEKSKSKGASRPAEMNVPGKGGQQQLSLVQHNSQPLRGGQVKSDSPKTTHGKFLVLKPVWENGVLKDGSNPISNVNSRTANCQPSSVASSATPNTLRNQNNLNPSSSLERKVAALDLKSGSTLEKRPPSAQSQSRNDFFNLIKKKTLVNGSTCLQDSGICTSSIKEKSGIVNGEVVSAAVHPSTVTDDEVASNGDTTEEVQRFSEVVNKSLSPNKALCTDEEEAAFLRSLGWEENSGEDEGLTEEEINAFYQQYMKLKPSLKPIRCKLPEPSSAV